MSLPNFFGVSWAHARKGRAMFLIEGRMDATALAEAEQLVEDFSISHRVWVIPILTAVNALGGSAAPTQVCEMPQVAELLIV